MTESNSHWRNLIRFEDETGIEHFGDAPTISVEQLLGTEVPILRGGSLSQLERSGEVCKVKKLLCPVPLPPYIICIGLNYADHAKEANLPIPPNPVTFAKPVDSITGPESNILVPPEAKLLDYEGELCIVISRTGKNIPEHRAREYIAGFTAGNDVSSRYWQRQPFSGGQFSYAKSFDTFAPLGPTLLHSSQAFNSQGNVSLAVSTRVNGETRQSSTTDSMLFNVNQIIAHVSRGTTLREGTVIMTGTPAGVAAKMKCEPWLEHGDLVEVEISGIGCLRNRVVFESTETEKDMQDSHRPWSSL